MPTSGGVRISRRLLHAPNRESLRRAKDVAPEPDRYTNWVSARKTNGPDDRGDE